MCIYEISRRKKYYHMIKTHNRNKIIYKSQNFNKNNEIIITN